MTGLGPFRWSDPSRVSSRPSDLLDVNEALYPVRRRSSTSLRSCRSRPSPVPACLISAAGRSAAATEAVLSLTLRVTASTQLSYAVLVGDSGFEPETFPM